jgi:RNA polymerase sigma factor (sigma-70 family)
MCDANGHRPQLEVVNDTASGNGLRTVADLGTGRMVAFERLYRAEVNAISRYFARRVEDPSTVADLTAETFTEAMRSFRTFDSSKGSGRAWLFAIAQRVAARYWESQRRERAARSASANWALSDPDAIDELIARIDDERAGRALMERMKHLRPLDRAALELVDLAGLTPKEAAAALGTSPGALRMRLLRTRARLRSKENDDERV